MRSLIRGGSIVSATGTTRADVLIDGEHIAALGVGWMTGAAAYGCFAATAWFGWRRRVRETATPVDEALAATAADLARRMGLRRRVRLVVTRDMIGPMTSGWLRPVVVMPRVLVEGRSAEEIEPLLAHELVHVRRGDAVVPA